MVQAIEAVNSGNITTITSVELAEISGRRHDVLMKSIERMNEDLIQMHKPPAVDGTYIAGNKLKAKMYKLSIYHCELLALALDGIARIKVLDKIEEIRGNTIKPRTYEVVMREALLLADQKVLEQQQKIEVLEDKIYEDKPKVSFANAVAGSATAINVGVWIKMIQSELVKPMGRTKAFQWLRDEGFIMKNSTLPYQHWVDKKIFEVKEVIILTPSGDKITSTTLVTGQGQLYLLERLRKVDTI